LIFCVLEIVFEVLLLQTITETNLNFPCHFVLKLCALMAHTWQKQVHLMTSCFRMFII